MPRSLRVRTERLWGHLALRKVRRTLKALQKSEDPILVGPWLGEVGFEVLYWIPFLRWAVEQYGISPERLIAVSRGGVENWYSGIASGYSDLFDLFSSHELGELRRQRAKADRGQKQMNIQEVDRRILHEIEEQLGTKTSQWLHPSLMANLFRPYWWGSASRRWIRRFTRPGLLTAGEHDTTDVLRSLPAEFVALRFYGNDALTATPESRDRLREICGWLADRTPTVWLRCHLGMDEHVDFSPEDSRIQVLDLSDHPRTNLGLQTQVIARASRLVSTYGGYSYLGPAVGTPTLAVYDRRGFFETHLRLAESSFDSAPFGPFRVASLTDLEPADVEGPHRPMLGTELSSSC